VYEGSEEAGREGRCCSGVGDFGVWVFDDNNFITSSSLVSISATLLLEFVARFGRALASRNTQHLPSFAHLNFVRC
jgi:hypothetical protein